jgi:hypothetical protein
MKMHENGLGFHHYALRNDLLPFGFGVVRVVDVEARENIGVDRDHFFLRGRFSR